MTEDDSIPRRIEPAPGLGTPGRLASVGFALAAAYFLLTEHRAHVIQVLPWAFLILCPLMHIFMHGKHGSHHSSPSASKDGRHDA